MFSNNLALNEAAPFYQKYINLVDKKTNLTAALTDGFLEFSDLKTLIITQEKEKYQYAPEKWTVQEVILHCIDSERIFCYRAQCISRNDKTHFPGFDENNYVVNSNANNRSFDSLVEEFVYVRQTTIALFKNLSPIQLLSIGTASNSPISVRAIGFIIAGHFKHHVQILRERYLM